MSQRSTAKRGLTWMGDHLTERSLYRRIISDLSCDFHVSNAIVSQYVARISKILRFPGCRALWCCQLVAKNGAISFTIIHFQLCTVRRKVKFYDTFLVYCAIPGSGVSRSFVSHIRSQIGAADVDCQNWFY